MATSAYDRSWNRLGAVAAYFGGLAFLAVIVLTTLDNLGALGSAPSYQQTSAGLLADESAFWKGQYAHQHAILWDILLRDSLQPLAFVAVILVALAVLNAVGPRRAIAQMATALLALGALGGCLDALAWLTMAQYWRSDWSSADPTIMVAVGRDTEAITNLSHQFTAFSSIATAGGLLLLGFLAGANGLLPRRLRYLAWAGAVLLTLSVALAQTSLDTLSSVVTLLGVLVFPPLLFWLGHRLSRFDPVS